MSSVPAFNSCMESAHIVLWDLKPGNKTASWYNVISCTNWVYSKVWLLYLDVYSTSRAANSAADFFSEFCWCKLVFLPHIVGSTSLLHFSTICLYEWDDRCDALGINKTLWFRCSFYALSDWASGGSSTTTCSIAKKYKGTNISWAESCMQTVV